ncbi:MAG: hypothetical protein D6694_08920 [Gammaproteobacteria bacterium]|nr:MAG: hypothetical protein D6694_08920 [Gammaproteobacteria bacterium]
MADIDGKTRMIALRFVNPDVSNQVQNGGNKEKEVIDSQEPLVVQIGTGITSREEEGSIQKESESANSDSASKEVEGEYPFEAEKEGQRDSRYVEDQEPKVDKKFKKKFVDEGNGNSERELVQLGSTDKPLDGYVFKDESFLKLLNAICDKKKQYWYQNPFLLTSGKSSVVEIMLPAGEYNLDNFVVEGGRVLGCRVDKSKTIVKIYPLENVKEVNLFVFSGNELKLIPIFIRKYKNLPWSIHAPDRNGINSYIKDWVKKNVVDGMAVSGIEDLLDVLVNYAVQAGYSCD